ncbi:hypothetical protein Tco_0404577 [Tanacetum coccineum]
MENLYLKHGLVSRTYSKKSLIMASTFGSKSKSFMTMSIPSQDEPLTNRPVDVPSTSNRRLIELENQVQRLMESHLAPTQPTQVNKITTSCEICSGPHDTQIYMENPEQAFVEYASSRTDEAGVPRSSDTKFVCSKEDDGEVMFIEIIRDDDEPQNEGEVAPTEEPIVEYFDTFPTREELTYHKYLMSGPIPSIFLRNPIITGGCPHNLKIPCNIGHNAVEADLKVEFLAPSMETKVYGSVVAYFGKNFEYSDSDDLYYLTLFKKKRSAFVGPGSLHLMLSALAVPANSSLIIKANLFDNTSDNEILSGTCEITVGLDGKPTIGSIVRSGYHQKDRKPSQNDKTEHGMEKTVQNQGQSPKMSKSESIQKNQQSNQSQNTNTLDAI